MTSQNLIASWVPMRLRSSVYNCVLLVDELKNRAT